LKTVKKNDGARLLTQPRRRIMLEVFRARKTSRAWLQQCLELGPPSISNYSSEMIRNGLLVECPVDGPGTERGRGRPEMELRVAPGAFCMIGLDIGAGHLRGVLCAADCSVLAGEEVNRKWKHARHAVAAAGELLRRLAAKAPRGVRLIGYGLGDPGIVDRETGTSISAANIPGWAGLQLSAMLPSPGNGLSVVRPSPAMKCLAEYLLGGLRGVRDAVYVDLGLGIGGAVLADGRILSGAHGLAGEFGHICVNPQGRRCACGARGCLETEAGGMAIAKAAREVLRANSRAEASIMRSQAGAIDAARVAAAAAAGDSAALEIFQSAGSFLGLALASVANLLDPSKFLFGGGLSSAGELLLGPARKSFEARCLVRSCNRNAWEISALAKDQAGALGAACAVGLEFLQATEPEES